MHPSETQMAYRDGFSTDLRVTCIKVMAYMAHGEEDCTEIHIQ